MQGEFFERDQHACMDDKMGNAWTERWLVSKATFMFWDLHPIRGCKQARVCSAMRTVRIAREQNLMILESLLQGSAILANVEGASLQIDSWIERICTLGCMDMHGLTLLQGNAITNWIRWADEWKDMKDIDMQSSQNFSAHSENWGANDRPMLSPSSFRGMLHLKPATRNSCWMSCQMLPAKMMQFDSSSSSPTSTSTTLTSVTGGRRVLRKPYGPSVHFRKGR